MKFQVGDKVVVALNDEHIRKYAEDEHRIWDGIEGTVTETRVMQGMRDIVTVLSADGRTLKFYPQDLKKIPTPPKFRSVLQADRWLEEQNQEYGLDPRNMWREHVQAARHQHLRASGRLPRPRRDHLP